MAKAAMTVSKDTEVTTAVGDVWFRYDDVRYAAPLDEYDEPTGRGTLEVVRRKLCVVKVTPKGVWLGYSMHGASARFVLNSATKRYACPSQEDAKNSFRARKKRQAAIYKNRLQDAETALRLIDKIADTDSLHDRFDMTVFFGMPPQ